jgi:GH15 family glucan-1,4-alpha-glucosidase
MYFSKYVLIVFVCLLLSSCSKDNSIIETTLIGTWSDGNINYTFATNKTFGIKYKRTGTTTNLIVTDSIWGNYTLDTKRNNIYFEANFKTVNQNPDSIIAKKINLPVWNCIFSSDSTMEYRSSSADAKLNKIK